jgi:hypothetical protein
MVRGSHKATIDARPCVQRREDEFLIIAFSDGVGWVQYSLDMWVVSGLFSIALLVRERFFVKTGVLAT